jgi:hypothetical protein
MKTCLLLSLILLSSTLLADNIRLKYQPINSNISAEGVVLEQIQAKLRCHFIRKKDDGNLIRRRNIFTKVDAITDDTYSLAIKKGSLTEWLPGFETHNCAYVLIILGKDTNGRAMLGDIVIMGQVTGSMSDQELSWMQNKTEADQYLKKRFSELRLITGHINGKYRIVEGSY